MMVAKNLSAKEGREGEREKQKSNVTGEDIGGGGEGKEGKRKDKRQISAFSETRKS